MNSTEEYSLTDEEITTVVEEIVCKMKNVEDKPKNKDLSNVKAEDIVEDKPKKNVVTGKDFAKLTKKAKKY